jgi:hypothetical protein
LACVSRSTHAADGLALQFSKRIVYWLFVIDYWLFPCPSYPFPVGTVGFAVADIIFGLCFKKPQTFFSFI